jgi:anti-sigma factor RsiW
MKENKECLKFKEMIMEKADGEADAAVLGIVSEHTGVCPECANYENSLINMMKLTSLMKVEAPDYFEIRVMEAIKDVSPAFNWFPVLSYGATFAVAVFAAFFLLYNKPSISKQDMAKSVSVERPLAAAHPTVKTQVASVKATIKQSDIKAPEKAIQTAPVVPVERLLAASQTQAVQAVPASASPDVAAAVKSVQPAVVAASGASIENGPLKENLSMGKSPVQPVLAPVAGYNPNYGVSKVDMNTDLHAAKVDPVPTQIGLPLLDTDKAIVANNLINPNHGDYATIVIKVEETSVVKIIIYDRAGRIVAKILNEEKEPGEYSAFWYGKNDSVQTVSAGAYFVYIQIGQRVIKRFIIVNKN